MRGNAEKAPAETAGSAPRGDLVFSSNFESGNLGKVEELVPQSEYNLQIQPDSHNHRYRVWFYFSVSNVRKKQVVVLNIINFSKGKSLYRDGMTPLVRSTSRPQWQRLPSRNTFYYKCPRHKMNYVLSFVFEFDLEDDVYFFAYCYPYTYTDLQRYLHSIDQMELPFYKREVLCRSMQHRRLDMLIIGHDPRTPNSTDSSTRRARSVVCITARVHPGETPASYMCHGLIEYLISNDANAKKLRKNVTFIVIPMLNPDGVFLGNYRTAFCGLDLNRQYDAPSAWCTPENFHLKEMLKNLAGSPHASLDFVVDLHSHSTAMNAFCYVNLLENDLAKMQQELLFLRLFSTHSKQFSLSSSKVCCDPTKTGTGRRSLPEVVEAHTHCYTLEVSFFGYHIMGTRAVPFTQQSLMELGRCLASTFIDYYKLR